MIIGQIILLLAGFFLLIKGADWFVEGTSGVAGKLGIPQLVVGLTIVAMGTSAPEAAVSITASLKGVADIAVGNVVGSNILNILIILGLTSWIVPVAIRKSTLTTEIPFMIGITVVLLIMGLTDGIISRVDGIIFWLLFLLYLGYLFRMAKKGKEEKEDSVSESMTRLIAFALLGGVLVVAGSNMTVNSATVIAKMLGMSERFIGLTIVALGTSLPELVTSVTAAKKGNADIAIGNIVGSNIFNILFILGTSALIMPLRYAPDFGMDGIIAILSGILLWLAVLRKRELRRKWGIVFLLCYAVYFFTLC